MNMTLKELGALLQRELKKWLGVSVHGLGVERRAIVTLLKDGEAPERTRDGLSAINVKRHVSCSPRARTRSARARIRRARPRQVYYYTVRIRPKPALRTGIAPFS